VLPTVFKSSDITVKHLGLGQLSFQISLKAILKIKT
jgi:hypothetical protein